MIRVNLDIASPVQGGAPRRAASVDLPVLPLPGEPFIWCGEPYVVAGRGYNLAEDGAFEAGLLLVRPQMPAPAGMAN